MRNRDLKHFYQPVFLDLTNNIKNLFKMKRQLLKNRFISHKIWLYLILCIQPSIALGQTQYFDSIQHNEITRTHLVYMPDSYTGAEPVPLLLFFHGYSGNSADMLNKTGFGPVADSNNFIAVFPQGTKDSNGQPFWNTFSNYKTIDVDDFGYVDALIDALKNKYHIDSSRIYMSGFSNGGHMTHSLAGIINNKVTAIAPVAGALYNETIIPKTMTHPTPVLIIHGDLDNIVRWEGNSNFGTLHTLDVVDYYRGYNNCDSTPLGGYLPDLSTDDGTTVQHTYYENGDQGASVEILRIIGGKHFWPGSLVQTDNRDINAAEEIWQFFTRFKLVDGVLYSDPRVEKQYRVQHPVTGINIREDTVYTSISERVSLEAVVTPDSAFNKEIQWTSSNIDVAIVYQNGVVFPKSVGQSIITATTFDGGFSASTVVIVTTPSGVSQTQSKEITLYPNPAKDVLNIQGIQKSSPYCIYTIGGRKTLCGLINAGANSIDISGLSKGSYIIRCQWYSEMFIK